MIDKKQQSQYSLSNDVFTEAKFAAKIAGESARTRRLPQVSIQAAEATAIGTICAQRVIDSKVR